MPPSIQLSQSKKKESSTSSKSAAEETRKKTSVKTQPMIKPVQQAAKKPASFSSNDSDSVDDKPTNKTPTLSKGTSLSFLENIISITLSLI